MSTSSATATEVQHEAWCTDHITTDSANWCFAAVESHKVRIEITSDVDKLNGGVGIEIYADVDTFLTPAQARDVAGRLINAADVVEAATTLDPTRRGHLAELASRLLAQHESARPDRE